jgi:nucleotide-binding universal stress UspA family protein
VLVVPRTARITGKHFVIATDGSRFGDAAAAAAGNLARLCGTPVSVLSVTMPRHSEQRRAEARQAVNRIASFLKKDGISVQTDVPHGQPDEMIVQTVNAKGADLIAVGSHGRTGLERALLGSTTERVLNRTSSAVLVVRAA